MSSEKNSLLIIFQHFLTRKFTAEMQKARNNLSKQSTFGLQQRAEKKRFFLCLIIKTSSLSMVKFGKVFFQKLIQKLPKKNTQCTELNFAYSSLCMHGKSEMESSEKAALCNLSIVFMGVVGRWWHVTKLSEWYSCKSHATHSDVGSDQNS